MRSLSLFFRLTLLVFIAFVAALQGVMGAYTNLKELFLHIFGLEEKWPYKAKAYLVLMHESPATSGTTGVTMKKVKEKECKVAGYERFLLDGSTAGHKCKVVNTGEEKAVYENEEELEIEKGLTGANEEIPYWAIVQESTGESGKVIAWGTCTGVSIGGTGTPVKIANGKLKVEIA